MVQKLKIKGIGISQVFIMNISMGSSKFMYYREQVFLTISEKK